MKAYQIVDFNNPVSVKYSEISRESYEPALQRGIIEDIIRVQCVTPETLPQYDDLYEWKSSLMLIDKGNYPTEAERSVMCSHWDLLKKQGESHERFLIMEHDSYLLDVDTLEYLIDFIEDNQVCYANIGLFMSCYTFSPHCAHWCYQLLHDQRFWVNGGPYGVLERLFKNYTEHYLRKRNYHNIDPTVIHPWNRCDTLGFGRKVQRYFNNSDPDPDNSIKTPTTQVISKQLSVTLDHENYDELYRESPWKRHHYFKVIP